MIKARRKAGRPRKNENEKAVKVTATIDAETLATLSAAGYSNSKLLKYAADVMIWLMERGEIREELLKGPAADIADLVEKTGKALIKDREAEDARIKAQEEATQAARDQDIDRVIEHICRLRIDIFNGKYEARWALQDIVNEAPDGLFKFSEIAAFLSQDERKHALKKARTTQEIIDHYNDLLRSPDRSYHNPPAGMFPMEGTGELIEISE